MKTPRGVPREEWLAAIAIGEAKARGLGIAMGDFYFDENGNLCRPSRAVCCCVRGALLLASVRVRVGDEKRALECGNDDSESNDYRKASAAFFAAGHAFADAMEASGPGRAVER